MFYDYQKLMSYDSLLNFIIGERGVGKSYGAKKFVVKRFLKSGEQFVYIRRYKTELKESTMKGKTGTFFNQIMEDEEIKDNKYTNDKSTAFINGKPCGYFMALSTANILKSSTYDKVKTIIFDEFIIDKGVYKYLQNEVEQFLDIIETIGRLRDVRVILLGNAISTTNPYFNYFNITLPYMSEFKVCKRDKNGKPLIIINYIKNIEYRETKKATRYGQLVEDTNYGKYAIDNEFLRDSAAFIKKKGENCKFFFTIILNKRTYGVWNDTGNGVLVVSNDYDTMCPTKYVIDSSEHDEKTIMVRVRSSPFLKSVIDYYRLGKLCFESQQIKNNFMEFINKNLRY